MSGQYFILLFFPSFFISFGIFFIGVGYLWSISIRDRELKRKNGE